MEFLIQVSSAFARLEEGLENSLKDYYKKQIAQLNNLISLLLGNLSKGDRQKVGCGLDRIKKATIQFFLHCCAGDDDLYNRCALS